MNVSPIVLVKRKSLAMNVFYDTQRQKKNVFRRMCMYVSITIDRRKQVFRDPRGRFNCMGVFCVCAQESRERVKNERIFSVHNTRP